MAGPPQTDGVAPAPAPGGTGLTTPSTGAALAAGALSGAINISIDTGGTTYSLKVGLPTASGGEYSFALTEQTDASGTTAAGPTKDLASFRYISDEQFAIHVAVPEVDAGGTKITGGFDLDSGTMPTPTPTPTPATPT